MVGCLANDTENLFTGGIEKSSEEIREVTGVTGKAGWPARVPIRGRKVEEEEEHAGSSRELLRLHLTTNSSRTVAPPTDVCCLSYNPKNLALALALAGVAKRTESEVVVM